MELSRTVVQRKAEEYREVQPLEAVEEQHVDMLPRMFEKGRFGRRDVEWVVQWFYRRFLGGVPDQRRRQREAAFAENDFETVQSTIESVLASEDVATKLDALTDLSGVDLPVASAFLMFVDPDSYLVVSEREWSALYESGQLDEPYPDPPSPTEYERYLEVCRGLATEFDCSLWTLYRALWRLGAAESSDTG